MAQKQLEERVEGTKKEIREIKESRQRMEKSIERNMEQMLMLIGELTVSKTNEASTMTEGSSQKNKKDEGSSENTPEKTETVIEISKI